MSKITRRFLVFAVEWPAALVIAGCLVLLVADYIAARRQAPIDRERFESLEAAAREDPVRVPHLRFELDRQTARAHERSRRQRMTGLVLMLAAVVFLIVAKWRRSRSDPAPPRLSVLRAIQPEGNDISGGVTAAAAAGGFAGDRREGEVPSAGAALDLSFVDSVVEREGRGKEAAIPIIQAIQTHYRYLPDEALRRVCELTEITPAQIAGVSSFYAQFRRTPVGKHVIRICLGTACHVSRARLIADELRRHLQIAEGSDTDPSWTFTLDEVACLGCCSLAPVIMIDDDTLGTLTPVSAREAVREFRVNGNGKRREV